MSQRPEIVCLLFFRKMIAVVAAVAVAVAVLLLSATDADGEAHCSPHPCKSNQVILIEFDGAGEQYNQIIRLWNLLLHTGTRLLLLCDLLERIHTHTHTHTHMLYRAGHSGYLHVSTNYTEKWLAGFQMRDIFDRIRTYDPARITRPRMQVSFEHPMHLPTRPHTHTHTCQCCSWANSDSQTTRACSCTTFTIAGMGTKTGSTGRQSTSNCPYIPR